VRTVLIVDNDLGFVFWVGQALDRAGYNTLPAKGVPEALTVVDVSAGRIDLLLIGLGLPGAASLAAKLLRSNASMKVVGLVDQDIQAIPPFPGSTATLRRPCGMSEESKAHCLALIRAVLAPDADVRTISALDRQ
jgi:hypothetical protein